MSGAVVIFEKTLNLPVNKYDRFQLLENLKTIKIKLTQSFGQIVLGGCIRRGSKLLVVRRSIGVSDSDQKTKFIVMLLQMTGK